MATSTRFEGRVDVNDVAALAKAAAFMSDNQLQFFFKTFDKVGDRAFAQKMVIRDEMVARAVDEYKDRLAYAQARNCL